MNVSSNTILITGGGSGIGLALAKRFLKEDNVVIICGRDAGKLEAAQKQYPELHTYVCDVAREEEREKLFQQVTSDFAGLNVLVNNAGIQRQIRLAEEKDWSKVRAELAINLEAPIHLSLLFLAFLSGQQQGTIINVSSGLAFVPPAFAPVYGATKAGVHSFTVSLRHQTEKTGLNVYEIIPPAVDTDLGGAGLHTYGVNLDEFADAAFEGLRSGALEVGYGMSEKARTASRGELDEMSRQMYLRMFGGR